jgi:UDP-N-acetylmuramyl pentapeptide synthase
MNFLTKLIFYFKKPKLIIVSGLQRASASRTIFRLLKPHFKIQKFQEKTPNIINIIMAEIFLIETDLKNQKLFKELENLIKLSQLPILVATQTVDIPPVEEIFSGDEREIQEPKMLACKIPPYGFLILNFDDRAVREIDKITNLKSFKFGFSEKCDFMASDINESEDGTNFKLIYKGNIIPIWLKNLFGKEEIYNVLSAICVGALLGLNIVEMSEGLKNSKE